MKSKKCLLIALALMLAACLATAALAENPADAPSGSTAADEAKAALDEAQAEADAAKAEETALKEALEAYGKAKTESRKLKILTGLKEELDGYVAAGLMTREQADLILKYYAEQLTLENGGSRFRHGGKVGFGRKGSGRGRKGQRYSGTGKNRQNKRYGKRPGRFGVTPSPEPQAPDTPAEQSTGDT